MNKQQTCVKDAQALITALQAKREACVKRGTELADERASLSFAAHAGGDAKAAKRLSEIHLAIASHASELTSIDEALRVAGDKLDGARSDEARAADQVRARQLLQLVDELDRQIDQLQETGAELVDGANNINALFIKMSSLGAARPTLAQVHAVASRALTSVLMRTPWRALIDAAYLAPEARREFLDLAQYSATIRSDAKARLDDEPNKQTKAA